MTVQAANLPLGFAHARGDRPRPYANLPRPYANLHKVAKVRPSARGIVRSAFPTSRRREVLGFARACGDEPSRRRLESNALRVRPCARGLGDRTSRRHDVSKGSPMRAGSCA